QGDATLPLLDALGMRHAILGGDAATSLAAVREGIAHIRASNESFALVVQKGAFESDSAPRSLIPSEIAPLTRERAIEVLCNQMPADALVVASTGMISRELYSHRET